MGHGYSFVETIVRALHAPAYTGPLVAAGIVWLVGSALAICARAALRKRETPLLPDRSISVRGLFDLIATFIVWLGDSAMGPENRHYLPFAMSLFVWVFFLNMLGLIPGFVMPTDQLQFNLGIALSVFVLYNYWGVRELGFGNYLKHLWGPVFLVGFIMFPIELISHAVRPLTLSLRLFGNMTGDHLALSVFTELVGLFAPVPFYFLGTIVCLIQAFVFTLLTMIYIRLAVAHGDNH